jgi:hypothetical protein
VRIERSVCLAACAAFLILADSATPPFIQSAARTACPEFFYPNTRVGHTHAHEGHQLVRGREVAAASISQPVTR